MLNVCRAGLVMFALLLATPLGVTIADPPAGVSQDGTLSLATPRYTPPAGGRVEFLIVTTEALRDAWKPLSERRTKLGLPADIVTVDQACAMFPACDPPHSIRELIKHLYAECGLRYVLIGGDVDQVPGRYLVFRAGALGIKPYVVDAYYACLNAEWNGNRNSEFGEPGSDTVDLTPQVFVGRVSAQTPREVEAWIAKLLRYREPPAEQRAYQTKLLCIGANVFQDGDAKQYYDELTANLFTPAGFEHRALMPQSEDSDERHVFEEVSRGYGVISHYQHSYIYNVGLQHGAITVQNYQRAVNAQRPSVMWSNGCNVCQFDYRSIAETLLLSEEGGVVAFVGSAETNFAQSLAYEARAWTKVLKEKKTLAEALLLSKSELPQNHFLATSLTYLGDPSMPVWTGAPRDATVEMSAPGRLKVSSGGTAVEGATVCVSAANFYAVGTTDAKGEFVFALPAKAMSVSVGVTGENLVPTIRDMSVPGTNLPTLEALLVDGREVRAERGVFVVPGGAREIRCRFSGAVSNLAARIVGAKAERMTLDGTDPALNIDGGERTTFAFEPGNGQRFGLQLAARRYRISASLERDTLSLRVVGPGADRTPISVALATSGGSATASGVRDGAFSWRLTGNPPSVNVTLTVDGLQLPAQRIDISRPPVAPDAATFDARVNEIRVNWYQRGFGGNWLVYRAEGENSSAPFVRVTPAPITNPTFLDRGLKGLTTYRYRISAVTPEGFEGPQSAEFSVSTALRTLDDWPKRTGAPVSDPILADLDGDGKPELIAGDEGKGLWIWHNDGSEWLHGGDNWTFGLFKAVDGGVFTPAIADLDGDGKVELITAGRMGDQKIYVWHLDGTEMAGWENHKVNARQMTPPRVTDVNQDGRVEVVFVEGFGKGVWIFNADGTPFNKDARVTQIGCFNYFVGPTLDVDGDGTPEIIVLDGDGKVQAIRGDGSNAKGYPVDLGTQGRASMCAGDVNGDGTIDLVALAAGCSKLYAINLADGKPLPGFPVALADKPENFSTSFPALADLDGKPGLEIIAGNHTHKLWVVGSDGKILPGWPKEYQKPAYAIAVADLTGNGKPEIVVCAEDKHVYGYDMAGNTVRGFPLVCDGDNHSVPFLGDFDGDGLLDLIVGSTDGFVHIWSLDVPFKASMLQWNGQGNGVNTPAVWFKRTDADLPWIIKVPMLAPPPATIDPLDVDALKWEDVKEQPKAHNELLDCRSPVLPHEQSLDYGKTFELFGHKLTFSESRGKVSVEQLEPGARRPRNRSLRLPCMLTLDMPAGGDYGLSVRERTGGGGVVIGCAWGIELKVGKDNVYLVDSDLDGTLGTDGDGIVVGGARTVAVWSDTLWSGSGGIMLRKHEGKWQTAELPAPGDRVAASALAQLNWRRQQAGLTPVKVASDLVPGLEAHCEFCAKHKECARDEESGAAGFSEAGKKAALHGAFMAGARDGADAIDRMLASSRTRYALLDPGLRASAFVIRNGVFGLDTATLTGGPHSRRVAVWPPHGMTSLTATNDKDAEQFRGADAPTGAGLAVGVAGAAVPEAKSGDGVELTLAALDRRGQAAPLKGDAFRAPGLALFSPTAALPSRSVIRARLTLPGKPGLVYEWEFSTK